MALSIFKKHMYESINKPILEKNPNAFFSIYTHFFIVKNSKDYDLK